MSSDRLAKIIAHSLARHQSRGLVDGAAGLTDVVIHGRVNLLAVAAEVLAAANAQARPSRRSWAPWFASEIDDHRRTRRQQREREKLIGDLENSSKCADAALTRLRLRKSAS